jgi:UDP-N-acetylmuramate dehydrogenase
VQNVGAYGQEVGRVIERVDVFDTRERTPLSLTAAECGFSYRMSRFKGPDAGRFIVTRVAFRLAPAPPTIAYPDVIAHFQQRAIMSPGLDDVRQAVIAIRRRKGMVIDPADPDTRSVGSFFVNPVVGDDVHRALQAQAGDVPSFAAGAGQVKVPAAWLIERAGIARGYRMGLAAVSSKHPLALVSLPGGRAGDIIALAAHIKRRVAERFGIALSPEPVLAGFGDDPVAASVQAPEVRRKPDTTRQG